MVVMAFKIAGSLAARQPHDIFTISVPNAETREAIAEADEISRKNQGRFTTGDAWIDDLEKNGAR